MGVVAAGVHRVVVVVVTGVHARSTRVQEYRSIGVYAVVQYAMSTVTTVTTVATRVLVAGVCCGYTRVSVVWLCIYSNIAVAWYNIQKHNYYYMYVLYINNV